MWVNVMNDYDPDLSMESHLPEDAIVETEKHVEAISNISSSIDATLLVMKEELEKTRSELQQMSKKLRDMNMMVVYGFVAVVISMWWLID